MKKSTAVFAFFLALTGFGFAQDAPGATGSADGIQPSMISLSPYESLNLTTGNILVHAPIRSRAGAADLPFNFGLHINFDLTISPGGRIDIGADNPSSGTHRLLGGYLLPTITSATCPNGSSTTLYAGMAFFDESRSKHFFPSTMQVDTLGCITASSSGIATDNTGYQLTLASGSPYPTYTIYDTHGAHISGPVLGVPTAIISATGNSISYTGQGSGTLSFTDSLGTIALTQTTGQFGVIPWTFAWTGGNGAASAALNATNKNYKTVFGCSSPADVTGTTTFPTSLVFGDGSSLTFGYEATPGNPGYITGRLGSITLPTGANITYAYSGGLNGINCADASPNTITRTTPDGTWTFVHSFLSRTAVPSSTTTVTDPLGNKTVYSFTGAYVIEVVSKDSTGHILGTVDTCYKDSSGIWHGMGITCGTATSLSPPYTETQTYRILKNPDGSGQTVPTLVETAYDSYGQPTIINNYYQNTSATLYRQHTFVYGSFNGSTCIPDGNFIVDTVCEDIISDASTNWKVETLNRVHSTGTVYQTERYAVPKSGVPTVITSATYNPNGSMATYTNELNTITTYTDTFCNNLFPASTTKGGLTTSKVWDCGGGIGTSSTDENSQLTSSARNDPWWRMTSLTDPLQNRATLNYTPTSFESQFTFNVGASTRDTTTYVDSQGRVTNVQTLEGPGSANRDTMSTYFDADGRPSIKTMPCLTTSANAKCSKISQIVTTNYDALGRVSSVTDGNGGTTSYTYTAATVGTNNVLDVLLSGGGKISNSEYDAFGRVVSVCEVSTQPGSGPCGQAVAKNGFVTTYLYDELDRLLKVTQGTQSRTFVYDGLSRLTSETNPETGQTQYFYDTAPSTPGASCSAPATFNGELVKKYDANGNTTCYQYDGLHRVTSVTYSGPNSSGTNKYFVYDAATLNGQAMLYAKAHMAEAYTATCRTCTKISDLGFGYSRRGELTDVYESTPHSGGYYHTTASYWANGGLNTLGGVPGHSGLWTFSPDGEGRIFKVADSTSLVTNTTYNEASQVKVVTLGTGDKDTYTYDTNTGRITKYQFDIGATVQSVVGALIWNANGTLNRLTITDPFDTADNQICNYGYDDLARVGSVNCGAIWSQTFSLDRFGNISKSGSSAWQATYSGNRTLTIPGCAPPTGHTDFQDANGNLLTDCTHTYTWDANNNPLSIDTVNLTYDALGRMIEQNNAGVFTEILYSPIGKLAIMNGQTFKRIYVPFPGGGYGVNDTNLGFHYRHMDWLGSERLGTTLSRTMDHANAFAPYGEKYAGTGAVDLNFTGQDQDTVSGLYDFLYREYSPAQGRWVSPDPAGFAAVNPMNPQTWNRYAYVANNPLSRIDPLGLFFPFWYLGFGGGGGCTADGLDTPCGTVMAMLGPQTFPGDRSMGAAVQCPGNQCAIVGDNGVQYFWASTNGPGSYYSFYGPGALYYSVQQAGAAGSLYYGRASASDKQERFGNVYGDSNGVFSYNFTSMGDVCDPDATCSVAGNDIVPGGTTKVADWHTHPWERGAYQFGDESGGDLLGPNYYPDYVATPIGGSWGVMRIGTAPAGQLSPICQVQGPPMSGISGCD